MFYCLIDDVPYGPFDAKTLQTMAKSGRLKPNHHIRRGDDGKWVAANTMKGLVFESETPTVTRSADQYKEGAKESQDGSLQVPRRKKPHEIFCPNCGIPVMRTVSSCVHCGVPIQSFFVSPSRGERIPLEWGTRESSQLPKNTTAVFVLGLLSLFIPILGIISLALSAPGKRGIANGIVPSSGLFTAGRICSFISLVFLALFISFVVFNHIAH